MRALRKTKNCLNCGTPLAEVHNYCPMCGQQNDDKNVSFKDLSRDLFENFFSFDSRLAHSFFPFFFKPGELTKKYAEGKRFTYANPIRLYIIVSVFYFFILNLVVSDLTRDINEAVHTPQADSLQQVVQTEFDSADFEIKDKSGAFRIRNVEDTSKIWPLTNVQWNKFFELKDDQTLSEAAFYDSLRVEGRSEFTEYTVRQMIRVYRRDKELLASQVVKNLSIMMFVMIPVFALLLKILYIRRKIYYINHLIHTIHIHTFSFFFYGLTLAFAHWYFKNDFETWLGLLSFVVVTTYAYVSFRRVYGQGWLKTLIKFWLTGMIYFYVVVFALLAELFISFLIF